MISTIQSLLRTDTGGPPSPEPVASTDENDHPADGRESDADPGERPFEIDQVFEILKNERRRRVLDHIQEADGQLTLGDLAERIAAEECEKPISQINSQERKRVYVGLYQCHLPKMDDIDAIEYDKARGTIALGEAFAHFERYLPDERPADPDWHTYLHGVSVLGLVTIPLVAVLGATTTGAIWQPVVALTVATAFAVGAALAVLATY
ncbi:DUF7344 domain-containing protein [Halococcoides cellulosivorans]|uniref:DUF7344 domain-containing protein n=1 Tax=Halococcoides cellulosivorans TaxID=1679096 RepID=A0A2R4X3J1_9EURY|nr:hypothetical protein [Halococcoides cellulosivorans]AWB28364.1 hypothetical protein HARCEL1_11925 [Halococcoides cellulosivorans]